MRVTVDPESGAVYVYLVDEIEPGAAVKTVHHDAKGITFLNVDYDAEGNPLGVEIVL